MLEFDEKEIWMSKHPTADRSGYFCPFRSYCTVGYKEFRISTNFDLRKEEICEKYGFTIRLSWPDVVLCHSGTITPYKFNFRKVPNSYKIKKRIYPYDDKKSFKSFDINDVIIIKRGIHYEFKYRDFSCFTSFNKYGRDHSMYECVEKYEITVSFREGTYFKIYDNDNDRQYTISIDKAIIPIERIKRAY